MARLLAMAFSINFCANESEPIHLLDTKIFLEIKKKFYMLKIQELRGFDEERR